MGWETGCQDRPDLFREHQCPEIKGFEKKSISFTITGNENRTGQRLSGCSTVNWAIPLIRIRFVWDVIKGDA